jgi:hypothetical protein
MLDSGDVTDAKERKAFELKKGKPAVVMFVGLQVRGEEQQGAPAWLAPARCSLAPPAPCA